MDVFETVKRKIAYYSEVELASITNDTNLVDNLNLDSLSILCLIGDLSDEYGIDTKSEDIVEFKKVGDIVSYIENNSK